jgi:hypothetical protein
METRVIILITVVAVIMVAAIILLILFLVPGILSASTAAKVELTEVSELLDHLIKHKLVKNRLKIHQN